LIGIALILFFGITHAADPLSRAAKHEDVGLSGERQSRLASVTYAQRLQGQLRKRLIDLQRRQP
jgi:hypothetical protein